MPDCSIDWSSSSSACSRPASRFGKRPRAGCFWASASSVWIRFLAWSYLANNWTGLDRGRSADRTSSLSEWKTSCFLRSNWNNTGADFWDWRRRSSRGKKLSTFSNASSSRSFRLNPISLTFIAEFLGWIRRDRTCFATFRKVHFHEKFLAWFD